MAHVRPHKWADIARGRMSERERARIDAHVSECARCARERDRVARAMDSFSAIREREAPELRWEHIGARIYWVTSSERRTGRKSTTSGRRLLWPVGAVAVSLAAATALFLAVGGTNDNASDSNGERNSSASVATPVIAPAPSPEQTPTPPAMPREPAPALSALVTLMEGQVELNGAPMAFDAVIARGDRLVARTGKVSLQFGARETLTLTADSTLELREFDARRVELAVTGEVLVAVSPRQPGQTFMVAAGDREVHVRGTTFAVSLRERALRVACAEGLVAVLGGPDEVAVPAGRVASFIGGAPSLRDLAPKEAEDMERWLYRLPTWTDVPQLREATSRLRIGASSNQDVQLDGEPIGGGALAIRVMPGRHHVNIGDAPGTWIELDPGAEKQATAPPPRAKPRRNQARSRRRAELNRALARGTRLSGCVRALRKQDLLANAHIELEIGVLRDGTVSYLNIVDTNLPEASAQCVRDAIDDIAFKRGQEASWTHRIEW